MYSNMVWLLCTYSKMVWVSRCVQMVWNIYHQQCFLAVFWLHIFIFSLQFMLLFWLWWAMIARLAFALFFSYRVFFSIEHDCDRTQSHYSYWSLFEFLANNRSCNFKKRCVSILCEFDTIVCLHSHFYSHQLTSQAIKNKTNERETYDSSTCSFPCHPFFLLRAEQANRSPLFI